jgi:N-acetylglucosamine-6-sulfatase
MARMTRRRGGRPATRAMVAAAVAGVLALVLAGCGSSTDGKPPRAPYSAKPNIVFVLTDDLDSGLVQFMPHVLALEKAGMSFDNYTVTDSLCCPSRASIFTGEFPHDTKVFTNFPPKGGFAVFYRRNEALHTFAPELQDAGYRTAMMGKYLNAYPVGNNAYNLPADYVPPGWSTWDVVSNGYHEYDYNLNDNHALQTYGHRPLDYLTYVLSGKAQQFIESSASARKPFFLEVATFSPHAPFIPAPQDRGTFADATVPRGPSFNRIPTNAPPWLANRPPLTQQQIDRSDYAYGKRIAAVQSVDRMIGHLEDKLAATGQLKNTVFVFSSDNGYHLGQHGLSRGKLTAFETDITVPLVAAGPGIPAGVVNHDVTENIDLAPTFEELSGATPPPTVDGRSLVPLLHGQNPPWRTVALVEHRGPDVQRGDPDAQNFAAGNPPTYNAIRTAKWTYVRYVTGSSEYYDRVSDPYEDDNRAPYLSPARRAALHAELHALKHCHGAVACWRAARPETQPAP